MTTSTIEAPPGIQQQKNKVPTLSELASIEIEEWYRVFHQWTRGLCPNDESYVRPIYDALADDFRVVLTNGDILKKAEYWSRLRKLYGARSKDQPSHTVNLNLMPIEENHLLAAFDLFKDGVLKKKVDSALMRRSPSAAGGIEWVYVHESAHDLDISPIINSHSFLSSNPEPLTNSSMESL